MTTWHPIKTYDGGVDYPVLVWDGAFITVAHCSERGDWFVYNSYGFNEDGQIYDVTHWMPLPEPPK